MFKKNQKVKRTLFERQNKKESWESRKNNPNLLQQYTEAVFICFYQIWFAWEHDNSS
jgi:hypothetical protein